MAFMSPVDGATVTGALTLEASASDDFGVSKVAFYVNGVLLGEDADHKADGRSRGTHP